MENPTALFLLWGFFNYPRVLRGVSYVFLPTGNVELKKLSDKLADKRVLGNISFIHGREEL